LTPDGAAVVEKEPGRCFRSSTTGGVLLGKAPRTRCDDLPEEIGAAMRTLGKQPER
jgi:hypothetical protein